MPKPVIAVIEPDQDLVHLLQEVLSDEGYDTVSWPRRAGASQFIAQTRPTAAIVSLWLERPDDGWALLDELRRAPTTRSLPVILTTTAPNPPNPPGNPAGLVGYHLLHKPFDLDDLLATVQRAVGGSVPACVRGSSKD